MFDTSWTDARAGTPAVSLAARPRESGPAGHRGVSGCPQASRRAPEAFTPPFRGTGLPFGGTAVPAAVEQDDLDATVIHVVNTDATPLGIHSSRRPPS